MPYNVVPTDDVAADVAQFPAVTLRHWNACLTEIADNPYARIGRYVERLPSSPMRTYLYEITRETSISGETLLVFSAEFFPEYALVYAVDEAIAEVVIFSLRPR